MTTSVSLSRMLCQIFECMCEVWLNYRKHFVNQIYFHIVKLRINGQSEDQALTSLAEMPEFDPVLQDICGTDFQYGYRELSS